MHRRKEEDTLKERQARYAGELLGMHHRKLTQKVEQLSLNQRIEFKRAMRKHMQYDDTERREADMKRLLRTGYLDSLAKLETKTLLENLPRAMKSADEYIKKRTEELKEAWRQR